MQIRSHSMGQIAAYILFVVPRYFVLYCLLGTGSAAAHHAVAPHFDMSAEIVIEDAVITEWKLVNPHAYLYFDAPDSDKTAVNWRCELGAGSTLLRLGWSQQTFVPGQVVTVVGYPARRENNVCAIDSVVLENGTRIEGRADISSLSVGQKDAKEVLVLPAVRLDRLPNGQPNISGYWLTRSHVRGGLGGASTEPYLGFSPSEANLAAAETYDQRFDDPALMCHPINIISGWNHDIHVNEIVQLDDRVMLRYGFVDFVRTIFLDAEQPAEINPSTGGHSVGHWEEDVLVINTVGFLPGVLNHRIGILHSDQMHITERLHYDEESHELVRDYVIEDPLYLNAPYVNQDRQKISMEPPMSYDCTELSGKNNIRPDNL